MDQLTPLEVLIVEDASGIAGLIQLFLQRSGLVSGKSAGMRVGIAGAHTASDGSGKPQRPYLRRNLSTRPPVSTIFCLPV